MHALFHAVSTSLPLANWSSLYFHQKMVEHGYLQCADTVLRTGISGQTACKQILSKTGLSFVQNSLGADHPDTANSILRLLINRLNPVEKHDLLFGLGSNEHGQLGTNPINCD